MREWEATEKRVEWVSLSRRIDRPYNLRFSDSSGRCTRPKLGQSKGQTKPHNENL